MGYNAWYRRVGPLTPQAVEGLCGNLSIRLQASVLLAPSFGSAAAVWQNAICASSLPARILKWLLLLVWDIQHYSKKGDPQPLTTNWLS